MDGELHQEFVGLLLPHVADRQQHEKIVVGLSPLQKTLATFNVLHEVGGVAPDAVCRTHVDRGVELPSWPGVVLRRVAGAVEEHVVHTGTEHQVDVGLHLGKRCAEVFREPGEGLARREGFAADVGCRRGIFQHGEVGVVLAGLAGILTESLDAEV